ncbi:MAG: DUF6869 domain-containing protein [Candidatus Obscuribacterales bacterium]
MVNFSTDEFIDAWINHAAADPDSQEEERYMWALERELELHRPGNQRMLWNFIKHVIRRDLSQRVIGKFAAGPLEGLITDYGPEFIDQIEELAMSCEQFNFALGGVLESMDVDPDVWRRIEAVRKSSWDDDL